MKREPRTLSGTGGEIRAPRGTEVLLGRAPTGTWRRRSSRSGGGQRGRREAEPRRQPSTTSPSPSRASAASPAASSSTAPGATASASSTEGPAVAEGPPIPIAVEPDAFPQARITAPEREIEVDAGAVVGIEWQAEDDFGLSEVALVAEAAGRRGAAARAPQPRRRSAATAARSDLDLAPEKLAEGERLLYWLEAVDGDTVSGPKKGVSETHTIKIYSEAEHRAAGAREGAAGFEEMVALLGDRLETFAAGPVATADAAPARAALDARTRQLHERLRETARELRRDRAGRARSRPRSRTWPGSLRISRAAGRDARARRSRRHPRPHPPGPALVRTMAALDAQLDGELEKGILYLEQLLDKQRAEDLVRLAKDLAGAAARPRRPDGEVPRRADRAGRRRSCSREIGRMKERVKDLLARMAELSRASTTST